MLLFNFYISSLAEMQALWISCMCRWRGLVSRVFFHHAAALPHQVVYEAYGINGTAFVIECLTDNVNRSVSDVKTAVTKGGGKVKS